MLKSIQEIINNTKKQIEEINHIQLKDKIKTNKHILIDVREEKEYNIEKIEHAINIPRGILEMNLHNIKQIKESEQSEQELLNTDIYLYCQTGGRSALAAKALQELGLKKVYSLQGGITEWKKNK